MRVIHVNQRKFENTEEYKALAKKKSSEHFPYFFLPHIHMYNTHTLFFTEQNWDLSFIA